MKKFFSLLLLICAAILFLMNCNKNDYIYIYSPPDTSAIPIPPYDIRISKHYDSLFATAQPGFYKVQDFDIRGDYIYIWAFFVYGGWEYNLDTKTIRQILPYSSGTFIAADSDRVYHGDISSGVVMAYNLHNTQDSLFILKNEYLVFGLQVYKGKLYVLYKSDTNNPSGNLLESYNRDGELIESISYPKYTRYLTINRDIVYSVGYDSIPPGSEQVITRFDLCSKLFLKDVDNPSTDCSGIRSYGDYFFFTDWEKNIIGYVKLEEIERRGE